MKVTASIFLSCLLASSAGWAADAPKASKIDSDGNACTWVSAIDDWRQLDDRNLIVWVSPHVAYHVELSMPLFDLAAASSIGFLDHNHDGQVCGFGMDEVVVPHAPVFGSSTIQSMTKLDDAGLDALAAQYNVKLRPAAKQGAKPSAAEADQNKSG